MGNNIGSSASSSKAVQSELPEKGVFRFRVVEHLSWDAYDEKAERFLFGHDKNKPIANKKFKIKMPDGSVIEKSTNADGVIELTEQEACSKYEVTFEPENARMNNYYHLFYNGCPPLTKVL